MSSAEQKRAVLEMLLPACPFVAVVRSYPGVVMHAAFDSAVRPDGLVVVRLGLTERVMRIRDLEIDRDGWSGFLKRNGVEAYARVPWAAVAAIESERPDGHVGMSARWSVDPWEKRSGLALVKGGGV